MASRAGGWEVIKVSFHCVDRCPKARQHLLTIGCFSPFVLPNCAKALEEFQCSDGGLTGLGNLVHTAIPLIARVGIRHCIGRAGRAKCYDAHGGRLEAAEDDLLCLATDEGEAPFEVRRGALPLNHRTILTDNLVDDDPLMPHRGGDVDDERRERTLCREIGVHGCMAVRDAKAVQRVAMKHSLRRTSSLRPM